MQIDMLLVGAHTFANAWVRKTPIQGAGSHTKKDAVPFRQNGGLPMFTLFEVLWSDEGQDIAEYAVMLAVILVLVVGTIRLVGSNANNAFSSVASSLQ
jgi:Flp pilus assembly pilin Flp